MCAFPPQRSSSCVAVFFGFLHTLHFVNISCTCIDLARESVLSSFTDGVCVLFNHHVALKKCRPPPVWPQQVALLSCLIVVKYYINLRWAAFPTVVDKMRYKVKISLFFWGKLHVSAQHYRGFYCWHYSFSLRFRSPALFQAQNKCLQYFTSCPVMWKCYLFARLSGILWIFVSLKIRHLGTYCYFLSCQASLALSWGNTKYTSTAD